MNGFSVMRSLLSFVAPLFLVAALLSPIEAAPRDERVADPEPVDLFAAKEAGEIEVKIIPHNSERMTLLVENLTDERLLIRLPPAAVALPVLAQVPFPPFPRENEAETPQRGGVGFPNNNINNQNNFFSQQIDHSFPDGVRDGVPVSWQAEGPESTGDLLGLVQLASEFRRLPFNDQGLLSVPANRSIRIRLSSVCLDYGKPDPRPVMPYELVPFESISADPALEPILAMLPYEGISQREVQLAAWHLSNGMSWDEIDALQINHLNGQSERMFQRAEIERAKSVVESIISLNESDDNKEQ